MIHQHTLSRNNINPKQNLSLRKSLYSIFQTINNHTNINCNMLFNSVIDNNNNNNNQNKKKKQPLIEER